MIGSRLSGRPGSEGAEAGCEGTEAEAEGKRLSKMSSGRGAAWDSGRAGVRWLRSGKRSVSSSSAALDVREGRRTIGKVEARAGGREDFETLLMGEERRLGEEECIAAGGSQRTGELGEEMDGVRGRGGESERVRMRVSG